MKDNINDDRYTLLVGKPPFQTKDVKEIYKRIKDNLYEFPIDDPIPTEAEDLISCILTPDPNDRPALHEILDHPFFYGITPSSIPTTARISRPDFSSVTSAASRQNMRRLRQQVELDISRPIAAKNGEERTESVSVAEQEREFNKAVAPSSPISTLLSSARQPLIVANSLPSSQPLLRQATTAALAEQQKKQKADIQAANKKYIDNLKESNADEEKLADQKLRIVSGMVNNDEKNKGKSKAVDENNEVKPKRTSKSSCFVEMHQNLHNAFLSKKEARKFELPVEYKTIDVESASKVFIVSWLDYCNKYGMGYALTDGTVGVYFNDSTSMVLAPIKTRLDYIASKGKSSMAIRKNYTVDSEENALPKELESKMMILRHFEDYMLERLYGSRSYTFVDEQRRKGMTFVQRYYRMKNVIVFKLSNDVVQFNFYDHTKMILSMGGCLISYIDKDYALSRWTLDEIFQQDGDKEDKKKMEGILVKLKYCRDVFATTSGAKV
ncbi:Pkinase-domain-containing protein [Wallemia mellicola]|nr:Pkinase-domain-containing protein [Wallemia mellicola]